MLLPSPLSFRLAPLSEGRIHESGQLQCSYHGWTFAADGSCGLIPQAEKGSKVGQKFTVTADNCDAMVFLITHAGSLHRQQGTTVQQAAF